MASNFENFHPDQESTSLAQDWANRLISNLQQSSPLNESIEIEENVPMNDVFLNLKYLRFLLQLFNNDLVADVPCYFIDESPVFFNIHSLFPFQNWFYDLADIEDVRFSGYFNRLENRYSYRLRFPNPDSYFFLLDYLMQSLSRTSETNLRLARASEVLESTEVLLGSFLSYRISWFRQLFRQPPSSNQGNTNNQFLTITVNTKNPGLRLSSSPAYFINWTFFGNPTTPLNGPILPGSYIFGGDGSLLPSFTVDPVKFNVPPHTNLTLTKI
jgi:hypothetical protein